MPIPALTSIDVLLMLFVFGFGCIVGSFLNVVVWRVPRGMSVREPRRSICPRCGASIRWYDNIPLVSFALLGAKCRQCHAPISWRYPAVECVTGLLFALLYYRQGIVAGTDIGQVGVMLLLTTLLVVASAIDIEYFIIPDEVSAFGIMGALLAGFLMPGLHVGTASYQTYERLTGYAHLDGLIASGIGGLGGGLLVLGFALIGALIFRREALGFGDVKLMVMVGAFMGWKVALIAFFLSPFFGLLYGVPLLMASNEHVMPYGPFLSLGAVVAMVFRTNLCNFVEPVEDLVRMIVG